MRALAQIGGTVEDANRARALADGVARLRERAAALAFSEGGVGETPRFDGPAAARARKSFQLRGGELCGCGEGGCWPCASDGMLGENVCGCAAAGCLECTPPWSGHQGKALGRRAMPALGLPGDLTGDFVTPGTEGLASLAKPYVCMHSHMRPTTFEDYLNTLDSTSSGTTEIEERLTRLVELREEYGIDQLVLSAMVGEGVDASLEGYPLDLIALYSAYFAPDFFLPFVRGFDINAPNLDWIELCLSMGCKGIGELFCYGYGNELTSPGALVEVLRVASRHFVPVALHWEIGNSAAGTILPDGSRDPRTPADVAWERLRWLLDQFPNQPLETFRRASEDDPLPVKVILCHCGSGPLADDIVLVPQYGTRLDELLLNYPNVYFDLAGMQGPQRSSKVLFREDSSGIILTRLGTTVAARMARHPDRFLFGIDAESTDAGTLAGWASTIPEYGEFLNRAGLSDPSLGTNFRKRNAYRALFARPPDIRATPELSPAGIPFPVGWAP